jgi:cation/acetate symporter
MRFGSDESRDGVLIGRVRIGFLTVAATSIIALGMMLIAQAGVPLEYLFVLLAAIVVAGIVVAAWQARTMSYFDWLVARRQANGMIAAMAMAASISGCWLLLLAPGWFFAGSGNAPAWSAAFCMALALATMLLTPYLRKSGAPSQAAFLAHRYASRTVGVMALAGGIATSLLVLVAGLATASWLVRTQFLLPPQDANMLLAGLAAATVVGGGLRATIRVAAIAFAFLATTFLAPAVWLSGSQGFPLPQLASLGSAFADLAGFERDLAKAGDVLLASRISGVHSVAQGAFQISVFAMVIGAGLAATPTALAVTPAIRRPRVAQQAGGGAILLLALLLSVTPICAGFAKIGLYDVLSTMPLSAYDDALSWLPALTRHVTPDHGALVTVCGSAVAADASVIGICGGDPDAPLGVANIALAPEAITFAVPQLAGIPPIFGLLMSAGLVAAAVAAIAMSGFAIASAICAGLSPEPASHGQAAGIRLFAGRVAAAATLFGAAWIAGQVRLPLQDLFLWAASLGFAILMPVTVAAVWWSRANRYGAIAAMLTGVLAIVFLLEMRSYGIDFRPASGDEFRIVLPGLSGLPDIIHMSIAAALTGTLALAAISLATPRSVEPERMDAIRRPDTPPAFPDSFA